MTSILNKWTNNLQEPDNKQQKNIKQMKLSTIIKTQQAIHKPPGREIPGVFSPWNLAQLPTTVAKVSGFSTVAEM